MSRPKERNELEFLRSELKKLRSLVKHLKKELGRTNKRAHQYEDIQEREAELAEAEEEKKYVSNHLSCPKCGKKMNAVDIGVRKLLRCTECSHRETKKI